MREAVGEGPRSPEFFTAPQCQLRYKELVEETVHNTRRKVSGQESISPTDQVVQTLLHKRLRELKTAIRLKDKLEKSILVQLDDLRAGALDDALDLIVEANGTYAVPNMSAPGVFSSKPYLVHRKIQPGLILSGALNLTADSVRSALSAAAVAEAEAAAAVQSASSRSFRTPKPTPKVATPSRSSSARKAGTRSASKSTSKKKTSRSRTSASKKSTKRKLNDDDGPEGGEDLEAPEANGGASSTPSGGASTKRRKNLSGAATSTSNNASASSSSPAPTSEASKIQQLYKLVSNHSHANPFKAPVTEADAPGYFDVVKEPMDLSLIRDMIKDGKIATLKDFRRHFTLIIDNAKAYNPPGNTIHEMAVEFATAINPLMDKLESGADIESAIPSSSRRTRRGN